MRQKLYTLAASAIMLAIYAPTASANLQLTLSSGGTTIVVNDNGAGDSNTAAGQITFIGAVGSWTLNVSTGTIGTNPMIDINSSNTGSGTGASALTVEFSGTNFTEPFTSTFGSTIGGTLQKTGSITYQGYVNQNNALNGTTTAIGSSFSASNATNFPLGFNSPVQTGGAALANTPFSLTQIVTLSGTTTGTSSFDAAIDAVPEPATVSMLGGILLAGFGTLRRKMRRV